MGLGWEPIDWVHVFVIFGSAIAAAFLAISALALPTGRSRTRPTNSLFSDQTDGTVFLFDGQHLVDASADARALLTATSEEKDSWASLLSYVLPRFPEFEDRITQLEELGRFDLIAEGPRPLMLSTQWRGGLTQIRLIDPSREKRDGASDPISLRALEEELDDLRATMNQAPFLVWRETAEGAVVWANLSYLTHAGIRDEDDPGWPLPRLFPGLDLPDLSKGPAMARRASMTPPDQTATLWFDCHAIGTATGRMVFALPADAAVEAESSLRSFIQTLTKTFAHLTIGLAIFDRQRQLALFNPALIELTLLSPEFLSSRPRLPAFLDAMREKRTIPEPKDYKTWRTQMAALEKAAASGQYEETWTLPSGQTFRVTGRPHPDGAVAFLFEDISAEMSLTRRFRADLELSQAVLDTLEEAVAVFSPAGEMVASNAAYGRLWQTDEDQRPLSSGFQGALALWQARCAPSPIWARLRLFVGSMEARESWSAEARLSDGRALRCRFSPLSGGATMVQFGLPAAADTSLEPTAAPARKSADAAAAPKRKRRA
ncbi:diguanylate cyclase [Defluviimonas sp. 20V17]|uniref:Diguanylate cyclase n=1 Tax=Allgaiera indica TaxID=765699 RepID=A0AAN4UMM1_9RHOB|nr:PAS-domain containing protein [Allgaiera indica]KDB03609.1 diguanylate cyclase [Defluviimonas sp. 20V17]GHD98292.1 diguanylate cyclase [Allgaiera indica]SDW50025.1 PAS fold [Allgaiera indica]